MELAALEKLMHDCSLLECLGLAPLDKQVHYSVDLEPEAVNKLAKRVQLRPALIGGMEYRKVSLSRGIVPAPTSGTATTTTLFVC